MALFWLEIKRMFKTRLTALLLVFSVLLSIFMAYMPVTFEEVLTTDESGAETRLFGRDAVQYYQQWNDTLYGEVKPEQVADAVRTMQEVFGEYDSEYGENVPSIVLFEKIKPIQVFLRGVRELQANRKNGISPSNRELDAEKALGYYDEMEGRLTAIMDMEQGKYPAAKEKALEKFAQVERPYQYYYGASGNSMDYETLLVLLLMLLFVVIAASAFSTDEQTGAADIQRCTKHGVLRLAVMRTMAVLSVFTVTYIICLGIWCLVTNTLFGWEGTKTSVQMLYSITSLIPWNVGQLQWHMAVCSLLFMLVTICFTLLLSTVFHTNVSSLACGLCASLMPIILYGMVQSKTLWNLLTCILPSGGIGLGNAVMYEWMDYHFINIGNFSFWVPDAMVVCSVLETVVFLALAMFVHCRKRD